MASSPFNPAETVPGDSDLQAAFPAAERTFRDIIESWLLIEHGRSGHHALPSLTTTERDAITDWEVGGLIYNETLKTLQFTTAIDADVWHTVGFDTGTRLFANQTSAPTGWTKEATATYENAAMRVTTGTVSTGGTATFTATFAARTIAVANIPAYSLTVIDPGHVHSTDAGKPAVSGPRKAGTDTFNDGWFGSLGNPAVTAADTGITVTSGGSGTPMDFAVKYVDSIVIIKS